MTRIHALSAMLVALAMLPLTAQAQLSAVGAEFRVNSSTAGSQRAPSVAGAGTGGFIVVWHDASGQDGDAEGVFAQRYTAGGAASGGELAVNAFTAGSQYDAGAFFDAGRDEFVVVWSDYGVDSDVRTRRVPLTGAPGAEEILVNSYTTGAQADADVVVLDNGTAVISWAGFGRNDDAGAFVRRIDSAGTLSPTDLRLNGQPSGVQSNARVAANGNDRFVAVWESNDGSSRGIAGRLFNTGGNALTADFQINAYTTGDQTMPDVAADAAGNFVVVWQSCCDGGGDTRIFARRFDADAVALGGEIEVAAGAVGEQHSTSVAMTALGEFVIAWQGVDADASGIFVRDFDALGQPGDDPQPVNQTVAGDQLAPDVAVDDTGRVVVAWFGDGNGGSAEDVYARRFFLGIPPSTTTTTMPAGACGDPVADGGGFTSAIVTASDALFVLNTSVGLRTCELCFCDVNDSGSVTATDALATLNAAVGLSVSLLCPPCT
jgi:hypothetical protein